MPTTTSPETRPDATSVGPDVVDVLVDGRRWTGALSYRVPDGTQVQPGDAVRVPFGKKVAVGMVLGPGKADKATAELMEVYGRRCLPADVDFAHAVARRHFIDLPQVARRLAPADGKGDTPAAYGPVQLAGEPVIPGLERVGSDQTRRLLLRAPLTDPADLAAAEAARISAHGQVLVLCPTVAMVKAVVARFAGGADRVDTKAPAGAWSSWVAGTLPVAVGTRAAALYSSPDLAGIVVVEADHPGLRESSQPYTNARDLASARTRATGTQLVLITASPTAATLGCKVKLHRVGGPAEWPATTVVDRSVLPPDEWRMPGQLRRALRRHVDGGGTPVFVAPHRTTRRVCVQCGHQRDCHFCDRASCEHVGVVYTESDAGRWEGPCPECEQSGFRLAGWSVPRIQEWLGDAVKVVTFADLARFSKAGMVVLYDVDAALRARTADLDAHAAQLLTMAAQAAGPGGHVWALTHQPGHPLLHDVFIGRDLTPHARRVWHAAREQSLPPFVRQVTVDVSGRRPNVSDWPGRVLGPRRAGRDWQVLVHVDDDQLPALEPHIARVRRQGKVRVAVE